MILTRAILFKWIGRIRFPTIHAFLFNITKVNLFHPFPPQLTSLSKALINLNLFTNNCIATLLWTIKYQVPILNFQRCLILSQTLHSFIKIPSQFPSILVNVKRQHLNKLFFILSRQDPPILSAPPFYREIETLPSQMNNTFHTYYLWI